MCTETQATKNSNDTQVTSRGRCTVIKAWLQSPQHKENSGTDGKYGLVSIQGKQFIKHMPVEGSELQIFSGFRDTTLKLERKAVGEQKSLKLSKMKLRHRQLCLTDLQWSVFGFWKFSFIQALPALEELLDDGAVWTDDLKACDVGPTRKDLVQTHVGETLRAKITTCW